MLATRYSQLVVSSCLLLASVGAGCGGYAPPSQQTGYPLGTTPLMDMGTGTYLGFSGGLYPNSSNTIPPAHFNAGVTFAQAVQPRDTSGIPSPSGKYVLLSIGMSNTTQEFCSGPSTPPCDSGSFMGQAAFDPAVNTAGLAIVNGARSGQTASAWDSSSDPMYSDVLTTKLQPRGLSELQVQIVWMKVANPNPTTSLPSAQSDALTLLNQMGNIVRALKARYPNLKLVFISSRVYGGYDNVGLNPEPFAYEYGFSVKWLVEAQINQMANGGVIQDARAGDLNFNTGAAPWIGWGAYLWANGINLRSDGLNWVRNDFISDGVHPSASGVQKVGTQLLNFFKQSPHAKCWFLNSGTCP